jgi:hypothetical protein
MGRRAARYRRRMSGVSRGVAFLGLLGVIVSVAACSTSVTGTGTLAAEVVVPATPPAAPTGTPASAPSAPTRPTATPAPPRDPAAVARAVDLRATDLPGGWKRIPDSTGDDDSLNWVIVCARDAGISPGTLSGAATPDYSPSGTNRTSQVGSATGLFTDPAAAARFVALLRSSTVGRCVAAEAVRAWSGEFRSVGTFLPGRFRVGTAADSAGLGSTARFTDGRVVTIQFFAIRTGPIVTMLSTLWIGGSDSGVINTAAARIGARQRTA